MARKRKAESPSYYKALQRYRQVAKKTPPGEGGRFAALKAALAKKKGVKTPGALAAWIGRKKYGKKKFQQMAAKGRRSK